MRITLALLILVSLSACGKAPYSADAELVEYIERYKQIGNIEVGNLEIHLADLMPGVGGMCELVNNTKDSSRVWFDRTVWAFSSDEGKENLVFHELGHCVQYRHHKNDMGDQDCAASYMNWSTLPQNCLKSFQGGYRYEQFHL